MKQNNPWEPMGPGQGLKNLHLSEQAQNSDWLLLRLLSSSPASYSLKQEKAGNQRLLNKQTLGLKATSTSLLRSQDLGRTPPSCPASCIQARCAVGAALAGSCGKHPHIRNHRACEQHWQSIRLPRERLAVKLNQSVTVPIRWLCIFWGDTRLRSWCHEESHCL